MTSSRNDEAILDAAAQCVLAVGMRRTTLAEIARRAGVSRPTVYRRWPDVRTLSADLLTRELVALLPADAGDGSRADGVERIVRTASAVRDHPLFVKVLETDPELLITYVFDRLGTSQHRILDVLTHAIRHGQRDGSIRAGDPDELAAMVLLQVQSAVVSARIVSDVLPPDRLDEQLRAALDAYLRPEE
ncbi:MULTISPECIES: TetR/AcrR family transcriptional regulator [unclassified Saccharopolyspora]|uniref:TetR/AcrR family transcriptional regulator n=1 Tax=unclassified Saccharopolyspora TaxID=2646250 RepID=UPI001CD65A8F|nr:MULTISPECIES: TetR/AcrR family transcriptional regulator [unclassified Saccharopolyspora]MCA1190083.1 TetR/AcrR family transcriptional regulator [Saccharopolyspora sp. 6T]MCA1191944.1 TetR/AcrR family transcriptional regulator [Saccharopolyspora sp. 6V]MCA1224867.1 TetR/AcrR family transcriptional regulator [Saccharopolyspora sp. 6M]MCA1279788.1 TetR/AcrR family transcriptional regulator [Saccharopolyspora sp. 7B]